jgi:hypothetical protein
MFWTAIDSIREPVGADLAEPLRRLHELDAGTLPTVAGLDPFARACFDADASYPHTTGGSP